MSFLLVLVEQQPAEVAPTFEEFITWPDRQDILLAIVESAEWMLDWEAAGTIWRYTYALRVAEEDIEGGLPRILRRVQEGTGGNLIDLTEVATIALCEATPSSFFVQKFVSSYPAMVMSKSPTSYYRFLESTGTDVADSSGNGYNGHVDISADLSVVHDASPLPDAGDLSLKLTALNRVAIDTLVAVPAAFTITAFVKTSAMGFQNIWTNIGGGTGTASFHLYDGYLRLSVQLSSGLYDSDQAGASPVGDGKWHHVACVCRSTGANVSLYVDGVLVRSGFVNHTTPSIPAVTYLDYFDGARDEVAFFPSALTTAEVKEQYMASLPVMDSAVFVHTSDGASPFTHDAYVGLFDLHFSSAPISIEIEGTLVPFLPVLAENVAASLQAEAEDPLFGMKRIQQGTVSIVNYNGFLSRLYAEYYWKNRWARIYLGGTFNDKVLPFANYRLLSSWTIADVAPNEDVVEFKLLSQSSILEKTIPQTIYDATAYPSADSGVLGSFIPIWYGRNTVQPDLIDASGLGIYKLADSTYQTMFAVESVSAISKTTGQRVGLAGGDWTASLSACILTITNATYTHANYIIEVTAVGKPDGLGSYLKTWVDIVHDILVTFCHQTEFDSVSMANAQLMAPQELSLYQKDQRDLLSIFQSGGTTPCLERSVMARLDTTIDGRWLFDVWSQPRDLSDIDISFQQSDFVSFVPRPKLSSVFYQVVILYGYDHSRKEWHTAVSNSQVTRYVNATEDVLFVYTNLRNAADAIILAQRYRYMWSVIPLEVDCTEIGIRSLNSRVGDIATVQYTPAPTLTKSFSSERFAVTRIQQEFTKPPMMSFTLSLLRGVAGVIGTWQNVGAPTWAAATALQRLSSGFWTNAAGFADPADPTSYKTSLWW